MRLTLTQTCFALFLWTLLQSARSEYYINQNDPDDSPDGSLEHPFIDLNQTISTLGTGTYQITLLGSNISIDSPLLIPENSEYTIKPERIPTGMTHFPLYLEEGGSILVNQGILTIENIQIIELNLYKGTTDNAITLTGGSLTLNVAQTFLRVLLKDLYYTDSYYAFVTTDGSVSPTELTLRECEFSSVGNIAISLTTTKLNVMDSVFYDMQQALTAFFMVMLNFGDGVEVKFVNNTLERAYFGTNDETQGFLMQIWTTTNIYLQDFTVKDVTLDNNIALISLVSDMEDVEVLPTMTIQNLSFENIFENEIVNKRTENGLLLDIRGFTSLVINSITFMNVQIKYTSSVRYYPSSTSTSLSTASINGVSIEYCTNQQFFITAVNELAFEGVVIDDSAYNSTEVVYPFFLFVDVPSVSIKKCQGQNITGPIFRFFRIFDQIIDGCHFLDLKTSQLINPDNQYVLQIIRNDEAATYNTRKGSEDSMVTNISNLFIDGYTDINGLDSTRDANDTYVLRITSQFGKFYLSDSQLLNVEMGGVFAGYINHFEVNNLTVDTDPSTSFEEVAKHRVIQLMEVQDFIMTNSRFSNQKNTQLLNLYNIRRQTAFPAFPSCSLIFDNITVIENSGANYELDQLHANLFLVRSPLKPAKVAFQNSYFENNVILNGLIFTDESWKFDTDIINCTFKGNYAFETGTVFSAKSMDIELSTLRLLNNNFNNNICLKNGAVFFFSATKHEIIAANNIYQANSAFGSGGVAYIFEANINYTETNGKYIGNSAGSFGGCWYLNNRRNTQKEPQVTFKDTSFSQSTSSNRGGALYIETGDVSLDNCNLKENKAISAGGDIYLVALASIRLNKVEAVSTYPTQGSFLYAEATLNEVISIQDSEVGNIVASKRNENLVTLNAGTLVILDSVFSNISLPLFQLLSANVTLKDSLINQITCQSKAPFCILQATNSRVSMINNQITHVVSNHDLMIINAPLDTITIDNLQILDVKKASDSKTVELFALVFNRAGNVRIENSEFNQLEVSSVKAANSNVSVSNTVFSNAVVSRNLQEELVTASILPTKKTRFILLDSSNSSIIASLFKENSPDEDLYGGAIRIIGNEGNHEILQCTFEGNRGMNGAAISVENKIKSFRVEDSLFKRNVASQDGSGIYIEDIESEQDFVIKSCTFEENSALRGGGIYVGSQALLVENCIFNSNTAVYAGGALASSSEGFSKVTAIGNVFTSNTAQIGAALMALKDMNFESQRNTFQGNKGFGGERNIETKPSGLRLKIYQVDEAFLVMDEIKVEYLLSHYATKVVYDSLEPLLNNTLIMKTGRAPNYVFEFSVLDELNQTLSLINEMDLSILTKSTRAKRVRESSSLFGRTGYSFNQAQGFIFNSFSVRGQIDSQITLVAVANVKDSISEEVYNLFPLSWKVTVGSCSIGEIYDSTNLICNPCSQNSYSFEDPFKVQTCQPCFESAKCLGANIIRPHPGYWRISAASDNFVACLNPSACLGGESDEGRNISLTGFCREGYEGKACSTCSPGYVKYGANYECVSCANDIGSHIKFFVLLFVQIILTILTVRSHIMSSNLSEKEKKFEALKASLVKVIIDFLHVIGLNKYLNLVKLITNQPFKLKEYMSISGQATPTKEVFSVDCLISLIRGTNEDIFLIKLAILVIQPIIFIWCGVLAWVLIFRATGSKVLGNKDFQRKVILTTVVIVYILQPDILKNTFQLFNCVNFGPTYDQQNFLQEEPNIACWEPKHVVWVLALGIPSFIVWLVLPSIAILYLKKKKDLAKLEEYRNQYNFIFEKYRPNRFYWELIVLGRKIFLILLTVFLSFNFLQAYLSVIVLGCAVVLQKTFKPYSDPRINRVETVSLYASAGIIYTGLFFVRRTSASAVDIILLTLDIIAGIFFFATCLYVVKRLVKQKLNILREKMDAIIDVDTFRWQGIRSMYKRIKVNLGVKEGVAQLQNTATEIVNIVESNNTLDNHNKPKPKPQYNKSKTHVLLQDSLSDLEDLKKYNKLHKANQPLPVLKEENTQDVKKEMDGFQITELKKVRSAMVPKIPHNLFSPIKEARKAKNDFDIKQTKPLLESFDNLTLKSTEKKELEE